MKSLQIKKEKETNSRKTQFFIVEANTFTAAANYLQIYKLDFSPSDTNLQKHQEKRISTNAKAFYTFSNLKQVKILEKVGADHVKAGCPFSFPAAFGEIFLLQSSSASTKQDESKSKNSETVSCCSLVGRRGMKVKVESGRVGGLANR